MPQPSRGSAARSSSGPARCRHAQEKSWLDAEIADHLQLGTAFDARGDQPLAGWLRVAAGDREPA